MLTVRCCVPQKGPSDGVLSHALVVWIGDLNYRINLPEDAVVAHIEDRSWKNLYQFDQLHMARVSLLLES